MFNLTQTAEDFLQKPFSENMNAVQWALLVIFVLTVSFFWTRILRHIAEE